MRTQILYNDKSLNIQAAVREFVKDNGQVTTVQIREKLGIDYEQSHRAVKELLNSGYINRVGKALYAWKGEPNQIRETPAQDKIWKLIRISKTFTVRSIEELVELNHDYIKQFITWLKNQGYITAVGKEAVLGQKAKVTVYQVCPEHRFTVATPRYKRERVCH